MLTQNRADTRDWVQERRDRTRQLIELGGLMHKAGLVEMLEDDRATLLGLLLEAAQQLQQDGPEGKNAATLKARWKHKGMRAFEVEREAASTSG